MTFGISRVHGTLLNPKNFAGVGLQDFTLKFWVGNTAATINTDATLAGGALEQAFRTAVETVGSVSRVGTLDTSTLAYSTINFAVESLGFEGDNSGNGFLGTGPDNEAGTITTTAGALQAAIQALGTVTNSAGGVVHLTSATVVKFTY
jgi:hypothetical protein